ncbi:hypothetical protein J2TS4_58420 [Paenibacillus sp. J2TS4]|nr:hypothetical protein J2TS4_58420 [Paenibacillus sp. J2TS4]
MISPFITLNKRFTFLSDGNTSRVYASATGENVATASPCNPLKNERELKVDKKWNR